MKGPAIYAITRKGAILGSKIRDEMGGRLYVFSRYADEFNSIPFNSIRELLEETFNHFSLHIFIMATGIVVRSISEFIKEKTVDPAVVVMDQEGKHVISLLSGHIGGANELAKRVAEITGGVPVITTATDAQGLPSIDLVCKSRGLVIQNPESIKRINSAMLDGEEIQVYDPESWLNMNAVYPNVRNIENDKEWIKGVPGIWVTWRGESGGEDKLIIHPPCLVLGIGCNRGTSSDEIMRLIQDTFNNNSLSIMSIKYIASIEDKRDEMGLIDVSCKLNVPLKFVSLKDISDIDVPNPSDMVQKHMGVKSVCEAVAIKIAGQGNLLVPKVKSRNVTVAVAIMSST